MESDNWFLEYANIIAPNAPTPADSVGVAKPANIEPKTETIKIRGGTKALKIVKYKLLIYSIKIYSFKTLIN